LNFGIGMIVGEGAKIGSDWASGGGANTGGSFTQIGMMFGPWGAVIGFAADVIASSFMGDSSQKKAEKAANEYWGAAQTELGQMRKGQSQQRGGALASMGASGASIRSGSLQVYRGEQQKQQDLAFSRQYDEFRRTYNEIKESGGSGGIF
jgi:hypothetical protein